MSQLSRQRHFGQGVFLLLLCIILLSGCGGKTVVHDLNQKQANEIVSVLSAHGIPAEASKATGGKARFEVLVRSSHYTRAVSLLTQYGLPRTAEATFSELIEKKGIIPDSREVEALRLDHALAVQLQEVMENHAAVSKAKVLVRMHSADAEQAGVSVVIQKYPEQELLAGDIMQLVRSAVPGIKEEAVFVTIHDFQKRLHQPEEAGVFIDGENLVRVPLVPFLFGWHVPEGDYNAIALSLVAFLAVMGIAGGVIGYWFGYLQQGRQSYESPELPNLSSESLQLSGPDGMETSEV